MSKDTIKFITEGFKSLLIKSQSDIQGKIKALKQSTAVVKASKAEYQKGFNKNSN